MIFQAQITIMPLADLLDPQGKAVSGVLHNLGLPEIQDVRIGKHIVMQVDADSREQAEEITRKACEQVLYNPVMETYSLVIEG